jgi:hypothetical protein
MGSESRLRQFAHVEHGAVDSSAEAADAERHPPLEALSNTADVANIFFTGALLACIVAGVVGRWACRTGGRDRNSDDVDEK